MQIDKVNCAVCGETLDELDSVYCERCGKPFHWYDCQGWSYLECSCKKCIKEIGGTDL